MLAAGRARWCLRCASLFVLISGRALAALRLVCIDMIRRCRYATHRVVRFLPCTAATTLTVLLAPVRQEAGRTRAVSSGLPSHVGGALGERGALGVLLRPPSGLLRDSGSQWAAAVHVPMASSRSLAAAGIAHPRQWVAWTRLCGCDLPHIFRSCGVPCGALGATRLGPIPGQHCGRTSKFECCELSVVVISRILFHKTQGCGGAGRWGRGRDQQFHHSYTIVSTPCMIQLLLAYERHSS